MQLTPSGRPVESAVPVSVLLLRAPSRQFYSMRASLTSPWSKLKKTPTRSGPSAHFQSRQIMQIAVQKAVECPRRLPPNPDPRKQKGKL
ncbi:hypothetical protein LY76DRAFT_255877 [Colletotrichum caudatum]|nr:hypothetical protein LY76DRAFT_255877 [Colletotrichum caudatum]